MYVRNQSSRGEANHSALWAASGLLADDLRASPIMAGNSRERKRESKERREDGRIQLKRHQIRRRARFRSHRPTRAASMVGVPRAIVVRRLR